MLSSLQAGKLQAPSTILPNQYNLVGFRLFYYLAMPFQTQFALSLELANLIPLSLVVAGKTYEAAMRLARDLQVCSTSYISRNIL
jgi:hypothetical protein